MGATFPPERVIAPALHDLFAATIAFVAWSITAMKDPSLAGIRLLIEQTNYKCAALIYAPAPPSLTSALQAADPGQGCGAVRAPARPQQRRAHGGHPHAVGAADRATGHQPPPRADQHDHDGASRPAAPTLPRSPFPPAQFSSASVSALSDVVVGSAIHILSRFALSKDLLGKSFREHHAEAAVQVRARPQPTSSSACHTSPVVALHPGNAGHPAEERAEGRGDGRGGEGGTALPVHLLRAAAGHLRQLAQGGLAT